MSEVTQQEKLTFAELSVRSANNLADWLLKEIPEIRGVSIVIDYQGDLNNSDLPAIVCTGRNGSLKTAAELVSMQIQLLKLTRFLSEKLQGLTVEYVAQLDKALKEHEKAKEQLDGQKAEG